MKMQQTSTTFGRPDVEVFYDGQLNVDYSTRTGVVNIPDNRKHWMVDLLLRGYEVVKEEEAPVEEPFIPIQKRKAKNGKDSQ